MAKSQKIRGVARYVRQTTFAHPSQPTSAEVAVTQKFTRVLGPKAQALALEEAKRNLQEHENGVRAQSRQLLQDIQSRVLGDIANSEESELLGCGGDDSYDVPNDSEWVETDTDHSQDAIVIHAARDLALWMSRGRRRLDYRTWQQRREREMSGWDRIMNPLADAYLSWKYTEECVSRIDPSMNPLYNYRIAVLDIFTMETSVTISRLESSSSVAVDMSYHGFLTKTPFRPDVAVGFRTLELFHRIRLRHPSTSIESLTKVLCDYYRIPFRRHLRTILSETYEIYVRILRVVRRRVFAALGWNLPNWRVLNACPACCYELKDEPAMKFSRLWAHDGNNSLKRMLPVGGRIAADTRLFTDSDYFLPRSFVDRYANEVTSRRTHRHREITTGDSDDESDTDASPDSTEGDATDGMQEGERREIDQCVKHWKAAASDDKKRSWAIFDENGIYASACRHGLVLWVADIVRSGELAKYPLAILAKALEVLPPHSINAGDIACALQITVSKSSLGPLSLERDLHFVVNAFHGYSHNYACQRKNHPNIVEGVGLEDFETMERFFSRSNSLASSTRHASAYRRRLDVEGFFEQSDEDKYANLGTFILGNYTQALRVLEEDGKALEEAKLSLGVTEADMDRWEAEEAAFFDNLGREPETYSLRIEYVEQLQALQAAFNEKTKARSSLYCNIGSSDGFVAESPGTQQTYSQAASATQKLETRRRVTVERYDNLLDEVVQLEVQLGISDRWAPGDPEYSETLKYIAERRYHRALDKLHQLVVQRLFELHKLNVAGTGYKTRTHIAKSLQTRCKAIRRALNEYNTAASELSPPREPLNMDEITHCGFVEHFALLQDTRNDIRDKPWAKPLYREVLKLRHRMARAKEEILRCNVETRRLHTSIFDQASLFARVLNNLRSTNSPLYAPVKDFATRRKRLNLVLLKYIQKIHTLQGFTGDCTRGVRLGSDEPITAVGEGGVDEPMAVEGEGEGRIDQQLPVEGEGLADNEDGQEVDEGLQARNDVGDALDKSDDEDDGGDEEDDMFRTDIDSLTNFFQAL